MATVPGALEYQYQPQGLFHDVDEASHAVSGSNLELIQLKPGTLNATLRQISLGDLSIDVGTANLPLRVVGGLDPERFTVGAFSAGSHATWNGNPVDDSQLLLFQPGKELNGFLSPRYGWTTLVIPPEWIDSIEQTTVRANITDLAPCRSIRPDHGRMVELWHAIADILVPTGPASDSIRASLLMANLRNALGANLTFNDTSPARVMSRARAHFMIAERAERYLHERIAEPVCVDDLCLAMHVSRRYLEYAFADAFGTSLSRYLRLMRLNHVRSHLKASGGRTTVTNEAFRMGFNHLSLFATQYKSAFGECPSVTLARATP